MKVRSISFAFYSICVLALCSCSAFGDQEPTFPFDEALVRHVMDSVAKADGGHMYADEYSEQLYQQHRNDSDALLDTLYWVSAYGMDERAEVFLNWLADVEAQGLKRSTFMADEIAEDLAAFRKLKPDSCTQSEVCELMGRLEYRLSRAYIRYVYGQRYGYVRPEKVFNNVLGASRQDAYRNIYDIPFERATDSLFVEAVYKLENVDDMSDFLSQIQPTDSMFFRMCREYKRAMDAGEKQRSELARLNVERFRWRYERPGNTGKYIFVNIPSYELLAKDNEAGRTLQMKICCGKSDHRTPLLNSRINRLELNPYWNVPSSIICNEVAPAHTGDSGYFARNRMVAINHSTGAVVSAASLTAAQWRSGKFGLRQERGAGNSLGRMIFRFPNRFSVYLHDTNSRGAFERDVRAVSHGCVRLEHPLDLAVFLMDNPSDLLIDKIRVAIDKSPLTDEGRSYQAKTIPENYMKSYSYDPSVPVYINYYTLYPNEEGKFREYSDVYKYDGPLKKALDEF